MKTTALALCLLLTPFLQLLRGADDPVDPQRARQLHQKARSGEKLTPEEQTEYERAKASRGKRGDRKAKSAPAATTNTATAKPAQHFIPLTELGDGKYKGQDGGLYGGGRNEPPKLHLEAALREAAKVEPLDANGKPSPDGKIVLLGVGMSNTTREYSRFKEIADADPAKSPRVMIVDGAQGGQDARITSDPAAEFWTRIDGRLRQAGVTAMQVQVIWLKQAIARADAEFPAEAKRLQGYLAAIMNICQQRYPNARICYLSSRTYGGYALTPLSPEPHAYEGAFAVRWLIHDQITGEAKLNFDPARGPVKAPLLLWGPYLWADGATPRQDGFRYQREDVTEKDGTHPTDSGRQKVAEQLLKFFKHDPTAKAWFAKQ